MTFGALLKRLQKMTPEQLKGQAKLMEGCSGNWTEIQGIYIARKDEYTEGEEPGSERYKELNEYGLVLPRVEKGQVYCVHDH
jgi:hypothetical protein